MSASPLIGLTITIDERLAKAIEDRLAARKAWVDSIDDAGDEDAHAKAVFDGENGVLSRLFCMCVDTAREQRDGKAVRP